ncbi:hypothetical protein LR48_Vigan03g024300 [Vigna angularis]|uniref:Uncharacterized protein n=1 Tax=Phaseolus angularis TaxID=3914 RepID=A0A0L9U2E6_PHAAN|nr:hypothetical protein LR48_Vigan03g024300 [Vigna angularis]
MEVDASFTKCRQRDGSTDEGSSGDTNDATTTEVAAMNAGGDDPRQRSDKGTRRSTEAVRSTTASVLQKARSFGLFSLYITVAAEEFAGMTGIKASVRRSIEIVRSTTASVLQTSEVVRSVQCTLVLERSFGLFSLYITMEAEGFARMTGLKTSVRRSTEVVRSTTASVLQTREVVRSVQCTLVAERSFGLFRLYITVAAEGFAAMTLLKASVRRSTEVVR